MLGKDLAMWAAKMIGATLYDFNARINRIADHANQRVTGNRPGRRLGQAPRIGLSADDVQALRDMISTCDKIPGAVIDLTRAFAQPLPIMETSTRADNVRYHANKVLTADYTS